MKKTKKVVIVGAGKIGKHLAGRLEALGFVVYFFTRKDGDLKKFEQFLDQIKPMAVFITISTKDKGEAALGFIQTCIICSIPVITCEKGALSYHFQVLQVNLSWLGYSAAVGGGTKILEYLQGRFWDDQNVEIYAVLNSSLNFYFDDIAKGRTREQAFKKALDLKIAEPGAKDPLSFVNSERHDLFMKTTVLYNLVLSNGSFITPEVFTAPDFNEADLKKLTEGSDRYRFVVSFLKGKKTEIGGWFVKAAPHKINDNPFYSWLPDGVNNAVHIIEGENGEGDHYTLSGPGAGLQATTSAMLADFKRLCNL